MLGAMYDKIEFLTSRWTEDVFVALKLFAQTNLQEAEVLMLPGESLPPEPRRAWDALIERTVDRDRELEAAAYTLDTRFCHVLRTLNRGWMLPNGLVLTRSGTRSRGEATDLWDRCAAALAVVTDAGSYPLQEPGVPAAAQRRRRGVSIYYLGTVYPNVAAVSVAQFDTAVPGVIISMDQVDSIVHDASVVLPKSPLAARKMILSSLRSAAIQALREHFEALRRRFASSNDLRTGLLRRFLISELRAAANHVLGRPGSLDEPETAEQWAQNQQRVADRLLSPGASLRRELWTAADRMTADAEQGPEQFLRELEFLRQRVATLSGVSAELTAVAVGMDAMLPIMEWKKDLQICVGEARAGGQDPAALLDNEFVIIAGMSLTSITAKLWAATLLAEELGLGPRPPLRPARHEDAAPALDLCRLLLERTPPHLRLAAKALYAREFNQGVDEPPFPAVDPRGQLRPSHGVTGMERT